ncbi:MAG: C69 family dipeptidase [Candidatus Aminicenantes bacterium]|nr:C69 family dipeptidase [Candidatus Aminicenantes bacterium]
MKFKNHFSQWVRILFLAVFCLFLVSFSITAEETYNPSIDPDAWETGCTSIQVGVKASTDGSVITCHSCDGNYRTWVEMTPGKTYKEGEMDTIYWGKLHTETPWDMRNVRIKGEIPAPEKSYTYFNVAYPSMNEKGLAIGETTIGGRRELLNNEGLFLIENLERIVLQRCTTAREAIKLIGELVKEYGYGDFGECITIADPKEVWHFEIFGAGPLEIGSVWAAVRIPDDHVGVSANIPRISELNLDDPSHYMASDNVFSLAEEMGWWDPKSGETFKFWKAYSGRRPFSTREYFILSTMAPSLKLEMDADELPFSVKPEKKVSVRDVFAYYRQTYEGTELDATKNLKVKQRGNKDLVTSPIASGWMSYDLVNLINELKPDTIKQTRTIAISACSYSHVTQLRSWLPPEIGTVAWFSFDNPGQSPRIPVFAGVTELPKQFLYCGQKQFRTDSACWDFRRANRLAMIKWGEARGAMESAIEEFENKGFDELDWVETTYQKLAKEDPTKARAFITQYTNNFAQSAMAKWRGLGDEFWGLFSRRF